MTESQAAVKLCASCLGPIARIGDYRFKSPDFRRIYSDGGLYRCDVCGLRQAHCHDIDDDVLTDYYRTRYRDAAGIGGVDSDFLYRPRSEGLAALALSHRPAGVHSIFEVGAGYGINLMALAKAYPSASLATDEVDETVALPDGIDRRALSDGGFDIILMSHVLEHFLAPIEVLQAAKRSLNPEGLLLVEVPNETDGELACHDFYEPHVTFYEEPTLRAMIGQWFDIEACFTVGPAARHPGRRTSMKSVLKNTAKQLPVLKTILDRRRANLSIDLTTPRENGQYLRLVARHRS